MNSEYTDYEDDFYYIGDNIDRKNKVLDLLKKPFDGDSDEEITNLEDEW